MKTTTKLLNKLSDVELRNYIMDKSLEIGAEASMLGVIHNDLDEEQSYKAGLYAQLTYVRDCLRSIRKQMPVW